MFECQYDRSLTVILPLLHEVDNQLIMENYLVLLYSLRALLPTSRVQTTNT